MENTNSTSYWELIKSPKELKIISKVDERAHSKTQFQLIANPSKYSAFNALSDYNSSKQTVILSAMNIFEVKFQQLVVSLTINYA
jgi:hypothetical protein